MSYTGILESDVLYLNSGGVGGGGDGGGKGGKGGEGGGSGGSGGKGGGEGGGGDGKGGGEGGGGDNGGGLGAQSYVLDVSVSLRPIESVNAIAVRPFFIRLS